MNSILTFQEAYYKAIEAYYKAINEGYSEELENISCQDSHYAYMFACDIPGANIEKCMKSAISNAANAYWFLIDIQEKHEVTDEIILYCTSFIIKNKDWAKDFLKRESRSSVLELLKDQVGWKDLISQKMVDKVKVNEILL